MWDEEKRLRFAELRRHKKRRRFRKVNARELASLTGELLDMESAYLGPATKRLREQRKDFEGQTAGSTRLPGRKAALVGRLQTFLGEAEAERHAIEGEVEAVLTASQDSQTNRQ